jgi:hypothetical protein
MKNAMNVEDNSQYVFQTDGKPIQVKSSEFLDKIFAHQVKDVKASFKIQSPEPENQSKKARKRLSRNKTFSSHESEV